MELKMNVTELTRVLRKQGFISERHFVVGVSRCSDSQLRFVIEMPEDQEVKFATRR